MVPDMRGTPDDALTRATTAVQAGPEPPKASRFGAVGTAARTALLRLLRPYSAGESRIDQALLEVITDLEQRIRALEAAVQGFASAAAVPPPADPPPAEPSWLLQVRRDEENMRALIARSVAPDANCIDIGAHSGAVLQEIVKAAPRGHHIAYEPLPDLCAHLRRRFPQVEVRCAAVSDRPGTATFSHVRAAPEWSGLRFRPLPDGSDPDVEEIDVRLESLDTALPEGYVPALIKIDVEGAEEAALRGSIETLRRHRPIVLFEHGRGSADVYGTTPGKIHDLLVDELGFRIYDLDGRGPYSREEFERTYSAVERVNFVARP